MSTSCVDIYGKKHCVSLGSGIGCSHFERELNGTSSCISFLDFGCTNCSAHLDGNDYNHNGWSEREKSDLIRLLLEELIKLRDKIRIVNDMLGDSL